MHPDELRDFVKSRHQEMIQRADEERLANSVRPAANRAMPNLKHILMQLIARFEAPAPKPEQKAKPSKLATDSGNFRIR